MTESVLLLELFQGLEVSFTPPLFTEWLAWIMQETGTEDKWENWEVSSSDVVQSWLHCYLWAKSECTEEWRSMEPEVFGRLDNSTFRAVLWCQLRKWGFLFSVCHKQRELIWIYMFVLSIKLILVLTLIPHSAKWRLLFLLSLSKTWQLLSMSSIDYIVLQIQSVLVSSLTT